MLETEVDSLHPDIILLEDKKIRGWIEKKSKNNGYFGRSWKRYYVTCENRMLNYYTSTDLLSQKGMINFNNITPKLAVLTEFSFVITVPVVHGSKEFVFKVRSRQQQTAWMTVIA